MVRVDEPNAAGSLGTVGAPAQATAYTYNVLNSLVRVQQGAQNRYFRYDSLGRLTHERQVEHTAPHSFSDPLTGNNAWSQRMIYDAEGRLSEVFDARNIRTQYSYDSLNRVTQAVYSDGTPTVSYAYDQARTVYHNHGQLTEVATAAVGGAPLTRQVYDYTQMGQVARQQQTIGASTYTLTYGYNQAGQLVSETYPSGRVVKYDYDARAGDPQSFNRYAYTRNDPVNRVDPTGLEDDVIRINIYGNRFDSFNTHYYLFGMGAGYHIADTWDIGPWVDYTPDPVPFVPEPEPEPTPEPTPESPCNPYFFDGESRSTDIYGNVFSGADLNTFGRLIYAESSDNDDERAGGKRHIQQNFRWSLLNL